MRFCSCFAVVCFFLGACASEPPRIPDKSTADALLGAFDGRFSVHDPDHQNWRDRSFLLHLPPDYDGGAVPVVFAFHGGGGNAESANKLSCKDGNTWDASCLTALADEEGFAVVAPEGTPAVLFPNHRTWNAGGKPEDEEFRCVSGRACADQVDDVAFFDALLEEVKRGVHVDERRIFVTGMSNGGAMAHRLACERSTIVAAIAPVGGGNQLQVTTGCSPARPVPVLQIHGTKDPCWRFDEDAELSTCGAKINEKAHITIEESMEGWRARNGCAEGGEEEEVGSDSVRVSFSSCIDGAAVQLLRVDGGGHTWPSGWQYLGEDIIGVTTQDFSANDEIWAFFEDHPLPE